MKQRFLGALPSKFFWMMVSITRFTAFVAKVVRVSFSLGLSIGKSIEPDWSINMTNKPGVAELHCISLFIRKTNKTCELQQEWLYYM